MADLILRDIDPEQLRRDIVADVVASMREILAEQSQPRMVDRPRQAELLSMSLPTLDRLVSEDQIPSVTVGTRRLFVPEKVIAALSESK